jgi:hypothetical protein
VGSPDCDADFASLVCHMWIALEIAYHLVMKYVSCFSLRSIFLHVFFVLRLYMHVCSVIIISFLFQKENVRPGRKGPLDDALLEFFRKEVV